MAEQFTNFAKSALSSGISSSDTAIPVTSGTNFPTSDFYIIIGDATREIVHCSSRSGNTITADLRGAKGTTAAAHSSGANVAHSVLAHHVSEINSPTHTGASSASRYAGATTSGPPASGTFALGDWIVDHTGVAWLCITAGTPGTWTIMGPGQELAFDEINNTNTTTSTTLVDLPVETLSFTLPQVSRPVYLHCFFPQAQNGTAGSGGKIAIISGTSTQLNDAQHSVGDANAADHLECWARLAPDTASATYKVQMAAIVSGTFTLGAITSIRKPFFRAMLA